jgi:hypothetical protein
MSTYVAGWRGRNVSYVPFAMVKYPVLFLNWKAPCGCFPNKHIPEFPKQSLVLSAFLKIFLHFVLVNTLVFVSPLSHMLTLGLHCTLFPDDDFVFTPTRL